MKKFSFKTVETKVAMYVNNYFTPLYLSACCKEEKRERKGKKKEGKMRTKINGMSIKSKVVKMK